MYILLIKLMILFKSLRDTLIYPATRKLEREYFGKKFSKVG